MEKHNPPMHPGRRLSLYLGFISLAAVLLVAVFLAFGSAQAQDDTTRKTEEYCLSCHGNPDLKITLPNGDDLSLYISQEKLNQSTHHAMGIECVACHTDITTYPHPEIQYGSHRELSRTLYLACQKCHSDNYNKTLDSMHAKVAEAGNLDAPVCTDCHGAHDIQKPDEPRARVSATCGKCHIEVFDTYKNSVHGNALIQEDNPDVPVCTDCHGVHNIQDPRLDQFRVDEPDLCAGCHSNPQLMSKYGLTSDVYNLYKTSWHGVDVSVYKAKWTNLWHNSAVCSDCHGIHNILKTDDPASQVNPANLLATCQKCHPQASKNFTGAWTGHYQVSLARTPFVFYTEAFYSSFTPFVLWISALYVVLQIIRLLVARVRRTL